MSFDNDNKSFNRYNNDGEQRPRRPRVGGYNREGGERPYRSSYSSHGNSYILLNILQTVVFMLRSSKKTRRDVNILLRSYLPPLLCAVTDLL